MRWRKLGRLLEPARERWMVTHAAVPFVEHRDGSEYRMYFTARDDRNRSHTGYAAFDINDPIASLEVNPKTLLDPGSLGAFDDNGAMGSWLVDDGDRKLLYYIGWTLGGTVPFYSFTGLAESFDGGDTFTRVSRGYLLARDDIDPYIATNPGVLKDGSRWRMYYISGVEWVIENGEPKHYYHIKYAESDDGVQWRRDGTVSLDFRHREEYAIARPAVYKRDGYYEMWYSYRAQPGIDTYRIGYATSDDGVTFERRDNEAGIDVSDSGFDSEMIEYAFCFDHGSDRYMVYNGNGYGRTGIGIAVLEQP